MENKDEIIKKLNSGDVELLQEAVNMIKAEGDFLILPELFRLLETEQEHAVVNVVISLLADVKDKSFKDILINQITDTVDPRVKAILLRICWESALDFSEDARLFARIMIEDEFAVALEASTVLEELQMIPENEREEVLKILRSKKVSEDKQFLIDSAAGMLNGE